MLTSTLLCIPLRRAMYAQTSSLDIIKLLPSEGLLDLCNLFYKCSAYVGHSVTHPDSLSTILSIIIPYEGIQLIKDRSLKENTIVIR